jgi:predicted nucleotidyltransferase
MTALRRNILYERELKRIISLLKIKYKPEKIILFGSFAGGRATKDSDIDLMIIKETRQGPWERQKMVEKLVTRNVPVDLLVYTPREFRDRVNLGDAFAKEVLAKGKLVYEKAR